MPRWVLIGAVCAGFAAGFCGPAQAQGAQASSPGPVAAVRVIVNPDVAQYPLDESLLWRLFTMRMRQWPNGLAVHVFVFPDYRSTNVVFCRQVLHTFPYVLRSAWDRLVYTGTGLAPTVVHTAAEMRRRVADTPGAIGYLPVTDSGGQHE